MGAKTMEVGGGGATGLADSYVSSLQSLLNGGGLGTAGSPNPAGSTGGIMSVLQDLLSGGGGKAGGSIQEMLSKQQERDVNGLRARFTAGGGQAFGTPAQFAEATYRADAAPRITQAISGLQLSAILPLLQQIGGLSDKGIAQRQIVEKPGLAGQVLGPLAAIAKGAAPFLAPGIGAAKAGAGASEGESFFTPSFGQPNDYGLGNANLASLQGFFGS